MIFSEHTGFYSPPNVHSKMISPNTRILVTGACGSVGTALVLRLLNDGHTVCAFDQNEDGLFKLDQELRSSAGDRLKSFLGNVRDEERLRRAMEGVKIVFHCAALKHVYISEYNPFEVMQTNIVGTNNVVNAAIAANVESVVLTSSDKAVNPTSTMGASKLLGERLFIAANHYSGSHKTRFSCVRFGNVLNSNGSVMQIFRRQFENNTPLTITSTGMTRFFITMEQAVDLCLHTAAEMIGGEIFVMSMGSCNIMTLAAALSEGRPFEHIEVGHKPGEKLYEELVTESEAPRTVRNGNTYVVLPDTVDMMPMEMRQKYSKYEELPFLRVPLRSDEDLLPTTEVEAILRSAGLLR
ncbi:MAG: SDR family NAD(P)-dependent oxidoreductase [Gammaproteobacteria bacterium]|nr:SDR family NAD(P)-dependent oxidoreductase [Gammaproteobacteria bacterium]